MITEFGLMLNDDRLPVMVKETVYPYQADQMNRPDAIVKMINSCIHLKDKCEEYVYLLSLNTALSSPFALFQISHGTSDNSYANGREIIQRVLISGGTGLVLIHNHPSGDPSPSREDIAVTQRLVKAGRIMDIPVLDHIILGDCRFLSLKEKGMMS